MNPVPSKSEVVLQVRHLSKSFGNVHVLKDITFDVYKGEIFVIMGPSGSGKTVLLKHLIGLDKPDKGEVLVHDKPVQNPEVMEKYRLAMVFQSGALLNSLTVGENVGLYLTEHRLKTPKEIEKIISEKLEIVGLSNVQNRLPADLSGGMKKRVAIARALVIEPEFILYDEPTSELDPMIAVTIGEEIVRLRDRVGATSIVVTHDRDLAFGIADRIAVLFNGNLLFIGTPDELKQNTNPDIQKFITAEFRFNKKNAA
ncbi:MAG: transporter related [Verrucomicrobiales bacterium]|nr:transporter related [Verrucomicrobiales bacterium]MDB6129565.1 transporter related [Verrucomicrobiales bacterium]